MSLVSEAGSTRSFSLAAASAAPLRRSTSTYALAAIGGGVGGWAEQASAAAARAAARKRRIRGRATSRRNMRLSACGDRGRESEGLRDLRRDRGGLVAVAARAEAHAVHAVARGDLDRLAVPVELRARLVAEILRRLARRERAELQPDARLVLDDDRGLESGRGDRRFDHRRGRRSGEDA